MSEAIGIMEGAFFVGRNELIQWINSTFHLNITKIEQLGSGSVYCQIFDAIHPGKINMSKVNWKAHLEWEFINNLKILQQAFLKCKLSKYIEIERLAKAKYQDNLEFAQWMKRYYDLNHGGGRDYDPEARRNGVDPDFAFGEKHPPNQQHQHIQNQPSRKNNHESKDKLAVPTSHGRNKDPRSFSPSQRGQPKSLRNRSEVSDDSRLNEHDVESLYQNLMAMKKIVQDTKVDSSEKIKKMSGLISLSLKSKAFDGEKRREKASQPTIEKIVEDEKEVIAYS